MTHRMTFLGVVDLFIQYSDIISGILKIWRKATQFVTFDSPTSLDLSKVKGKPKDIAYIFKVK